MPVLDEQITDAELFELEELLRLEEIDVLKDSLTQFDESTSPNYKFLYSALESQKWGFDENGVPKLLEGYAGGILEGSSRSTKTWSSIFFIIYLTTIKHPDGVTVNIYRETYNEFKTTLYDDFKRILDMFGLDNPFHRAKEVASFKIGKSTIHFLGDGKHGGGCDYAFFNEVMHIPKQVFDQVVMRCRKFWWMDYNPSFTDHWVFDNVMPRPDVGYIHTTFRDNPHISPNEVNTILGYEPYLSGSYVNKDGELFFNGDLITEKNQPPPHPENVPNGTADEFMWKVYGLGLKGAMKGVIFPVIHYIDEFPKDVPYIYANDFGFTADPNAFGKYYEDENNIYAELLIYRPIETPEELGNEFLALGVETDAIIACDSSDKYTGENKGTVEMVSGIQDLGWENAFKIAKTKSVIFWLLSMKKKRFHVVKNKNWKHVKKEREKYRFKEINGIQINQPIDKDNHFFDLCRYGHMAWNDTFEAEASWN